MYESAFEGKIVAITGGTGSFGKVLTGHLLKTGVAEIRIYSRDEKKQDDMRSKIQDGKLKFFIGDVRDVDALNAFMPDVDYLFHAAALKQVPSCEFFPLEAIKTNTLGAANVLNAAIAHNVSKVVCLSTDKAVYPINAMGMSKAMMEKIAFANSRCSSYTTICVTRYGNVMASRGSVIPLFVDQIASGKALTITDPNMTRFMMSLDDAVELVMHAFMNGKNGDLFVQKSPAASIRTLIDAVKEIFECPNCDETVIGTRHGEKLFEVLVGREEMSKAEDQKKYFRVPPDLRDLDYANFISSGSNTLPDICEYNSHNTVRLTKSETTEKLLSLPFIQKRLVMR